MTVKEKVLEVITRMPDDSTLDDIGYELYVIQSAQKGLDELASGCGSGGEGGPGDTAGSDGDDGHEQEGVGYLDTWYQQGGEHGDQTGNDTAGDTGSQSQGVLGQQHALERGAAEADCPEQDELAASLEDVT